MAYDPDFGEWVREHFAGLGPMRIKPMFGAAALGDIKISFDVYPYTATGSVLYTLLPEWVTQEGRKMMLARLKDSSVRNTVLRDMRQKETDYSQIIIASSTLSKMLSRRKISEIAALQGTSPEETVLDFLIASNDA